MFYEIPNNLELDIANRVSSIARSLFSDLKNVPIKYRSGFPKILRKNDFSIIVNVTNRVVYLEVAKRDSRIIKNPCSRVNIYDEIFVPGDKGAIMSLNRSRLNRFMNMQTEGGPIVAIGDDVSFYMSDIKVRLIRNVKKNISIDLIYVISVGPNIAPEGLWQEFDSLIRLSISDWRGHE